MAGRGCLAVPPAAFIAMLLIMAATSATALRSDEEVRVMYEAWKAVHGTPDDDGEYRYGVFKDNVLHIDAHNEAGNSSYQLGVGPFTALTSQEFRDRYLGLGNVSFVSETADSSGPRVSFLSLPLSAAGEPSSWDWRTRGVVTRVKNQGACGACWAFGTLASIESAYAIKYGRLYSLSEQQLVDCVYPNDPKGCHRGGWPHEAYTWIYRNGGIDTEQDYPYINSQRTCRASARVVRITGFVSVLRYSEAALLAAVARQPVTVLIDAEGLQHYQSGIFTGPCGTRLNHVVTIVGYGTEGSTPYWIVKNSWGTNKGEGGYYRIARGMMAPYGLCGINMQPYFPTV